LVVRYEELRADTGMKVMQAMFEFLDIPVSEEFLKAVSDVSHIKYVQFKAQDQGELPYTRVTARHMAITIPDCNKAATLFRYMSG
jgi:hypothetical protein